ncbi:kinase-like domain-containing protein [Lactarius pseudohatsudake]|nr:kinase-like domain-containing protein [Lactarius pseudohatsudake]
MFRSNKPWPLNLCVSVHDKPYRYTPRSDFSIILNGLPVLLLEVSSDPGRADERRMLLEAACLVRLGNSLLRTASRNFLVKAIYIDANYHAIEHTLFQRDTQAGRRDVEHFFTTFDLTDKEKSFEFIFRLYNFLDSMNAQSEKLSNDFPLVASSLLNHIASLDTLPPPRTRTGTTQSSRQQPSAPRSVPAGHHRALITANGYQLAVKDNRQPKAIEKATNKDGLTVALKFLRDKTDELDILRYLQNLGADKNHIIILFDTIVAPDSVVIIVMPWLSPLDDFLGERPDVADSLRTQLLEGVCFLHEHRIAHLDLKPANILVGGSSLPQLSIIDFGLSIRVEDERTLVEGYRGTQSWTAPEVGTEDETVFKYSAILADRWACGKVLWHIARYGVWMSNPEFDYACTQLLHSEPSKRPLLNSVLQLRYSATAGAHKRSGDPITIAI